MAGGLIVYLLFFPIYAFTTILFILLFGDYIRLSMTLAQPSCSMILAVQAVVPRYYCPLQYYYYPRGSRSSS